MKNHFHLLICAFALLFSNLYANAQSDISFTTIEKEKAFQFNVPDSMTMDDNIYRTQNKLSIVWPVKIGNNDISALQDSLAMNMFNKTGDIDALCNEMLNKSLSATPEEMSNIKDIVIGDDFDKLFEAQSTALSVDKISPSLHVYKITNYMYYMGAAHGYGSDYYINYDVTNNKVITLSDLVTNKHLLENVILKKLMEANNANSIEELNDKGFMINNETNFVTNNFKVDSYSITFIYPPYALACYAAGTITIVVPKYTLSENGIATKYLESLPHE